MKYGQHLDSDYLTYSGLGVVNFSRFNELPPEKNPNLFDLLFSYKNDIVKVLEIDRNSYVDVGTRDKYIDFILNLKRRYSIEGISNAFSLGNTFFNFSSDPWSTAPDGTIILEGVERELGERCLVYNDIIDRY